MSLHQGGHLWHYRGETFRDLLIGFEEKFHSRATTPFLGVTAYRNFARFALGERDPRTTLGVQPCAIGQTSLFVVPSPSPANAHVRLEDLIAWFDRLAEFLERA